MILYHMPAPSLSLPLTRGVCVQHLIQLLTEKTTQTCNDILSNKYLYLIHDGKHGGFEGWMLTSIRNPTSACQIWRGRAVTYLNLALLPPAGHARELI